MFAAFYDQNGDTVSVNLSLVRVLKSSDGDPSHCVFVFSPDHSIVVRGTLLDVGRQIGEAVHSARI